MKNTSPFPPIIKRLNSSPYFSENFKALEESTIKGLVPNAIILEAESKELASILITNTHTKLEDLSVLEKKNCHLMIHPNSGYDNFKSAFVKENHHFPIIIGNSIRAHAVSEYILSALFFHYSPLPKEARWNSSRKWPRKLLSELTILILGKGHIGEILTSALTPLVKELRIYDPFQNLLELNLKDIDVLIPACGLNLKNQHMINESCLMQLNEDFLFINAARGGLLETSGLLRVLKIRPKAFAVLDVFENEPTSFESLYENQENLLLTSHIAGVFKNIDRDTALFEAQVIFDFLNFKSFEFELKYQKINLKNRLHDFLI